MGSYCIFEHFLEVIGVIAVEEPAACQKTGVVINDHDAVNSSALAVLCNIGEIARIGLPHFSESVFFKCLPVPHAGVAC